MVFAKKLAAFLSVVCLLYVSTYAMEHVDSSLQGLIPPQPIEATSLHQAAELGNETQLEVLLLSGHLARIDELSKDSKYLGLAPLHVAIDKGHLNIVATLIARGADKNLYDNVPTLNYYRTPLNFAIEKQNCDIVNFLLNHGAEPEKRNCMRDWTWRLADSYPLHIAARIGNLSIVRALLDKHANVMRGDSYFRFPLHWAATDNKVELMRALIEVPDETFYHKIDTLGLFFLSPHYWQGTTRIPQNRLNYINYIDRSGCSPLSIAASCGNTDVVKFLLDHGANNLDSALINAIIGFNTDPQTHMAIIHTLINAGANVAAIGNALSAALEHGATEELIRLLVSHNADRNGIAQGRNYWIDYPLHEASESGNLKQVQKLLHIPSFHANMKDNKNCTPLYFASLRGHVNVVEYLLQQGATINSENGDLAASPLYAAASEGKEQVIRFLCCHGANVDQENKVHETPLYIATQKGHIEAVRTLLEFHANVGHVKDGTTPLLQAIMNNKQEVAMLLLDRGAPVDQNDPLMHAAARGQIAIVKKLLEKHATITAHAIEEAAKTNHPEIAQLLFDFQHIIEKTRHDHMMPSASEDIIPTNRTEACQWHIFPSLQQTRPDGKQTQMCGYYALYNAACLLTNQEDSRMNRDKFCQFLQNALPLIHDYRRGGSLENLNAIELSLIVENLCRGLPIIAIEKSALFAFSSNIIKDLDTALEKASAKNYLKLFIEHEIDKFAIIAGLGHEAGHWFTIYVERIHDKTVLKITDSARKISSWNIHMLQADVLPFYLAANNSLYDCRDDILHELFNEYQLSDVETLTPAAQNLHFFINCIKNLKNSLSTYLESDMPQNISENQQILTDIRLRKFALVVDKLLPKILAQAIKIKAQDPFGDDIIAFYESVRTNLQGLFIKIKTINEDLDQSVAKRMQQEEAAITDQKAHVQDQNQKMAKYSLDAKDSRLQAVASIATTLRKFEGTASDILKKINSLQAQDKTVSLSIDSDSFVAQVDEIKPEFLELIKQSLPDAIIGLIGRLTQESHDPVRALFVGPPGNGKTTIAQVIAQVCHRPFHFIRTASLGNSYQFSRENQLEALIAYIVKNPNAIILFDEIDALAEYTNQPQRASEELQSIIDLAKKKYPDVVFIGTTNYKDKIPGPLLSRFVQNTIEIPNPNAERRRIIIQYHIKRLENMGLQFELEPDYLQRLYAKTEHFSIRDIESLFENVQGQVNVQAGQYILQEAGLPNVSESHKAPASCVITSANMEQSCNAIISTIVNPESISERFLAAAIKHGPALPYIGQAASFVGLGLSIYSTVKAAINHTDDITRQDKQIADANAAQDKHIQEANTRQDEQKKQERRYVEGQKYVDALRTVSLEDAHRQILKYKECPIDATIYELKHDGLGSAEPKLYYLFGRYCALNKKDVELYIKKLEDALVDIKQSPKYTQEECLQIVKAINDAIDHLKTSK